MSFEQTILSNLVLNEKFGRKVIPFLQDDYFSDQSDKVLFDIIRLYVGEYNNFPTKQVLEFELSNRTDLNEETYKNCTVAIEQLKIDDTDITWLLSKTEKFCQERAVYNAIMKSIKILNDKETVSSKGSIPQILSDALGVSFDTNIGHDFLEDYIERFEYYQLKEFKIPFDLEYFNKITRGGVSRKTLNIALGGTGTGKSLFMCHFAAGNLVQGNNVLYITLEMAEERIAERIDANLLDIPLSEFETYPKEMFETKINKLKKKTVGKLIIKEYPTASAGSANFRHLLNELKLKKNFVPDIIYIDYLNICMSSRIKNGANVNSYTYIKAIAEELRGLAVEFNVPIFSATQTTRSGFCLALDTKVISNGNKINISKIKVGDTILSNIGNNIVTTVFPILKKKMFKIKTESGKEIVCSEEHIFPTTKYDKSLKTGLSIGDYLLTKC